MRCHYVSNSLLRCRNILRGELAGPATSKPSSSVLSDDCALFCERHQAFIDAVKSNAAATRKALDPGYKPPSNVCLDEETQISEEYAPRHIVEACCPEALLCADENPCGGITHMTDKEITKNSIAAMDRSLKRIQDVREIVMNRFTLCLKNKPNISDDNNRVKICIRTAEDRAKMDQLRADMAYSRLNKRVLSFLDKAYRKHRINSVAYPNHSQPKQWLASDFLRSPDARCEHVEKLTAPAPISYITPLVAEENNVEECVKAVLNSIVTAVEQSMVRRCTTPRIPMSNYCLKHLSNDSETVLQKKCRICSAPCLRIDGSLCRQHARRNKLLAKSASHSTLSITPYTSGSSPLRSPLAKDRLGRSSSIKGWRPAAPNGNTKSQVVMNGDGGRKPLNGSVVNGAGDARKLPAVTVSQLNLKSRRPCNGTQHVPDHERANDSMLIVNSSRLEQNGCEMFKIDEDLPLGQLVHELDKARKIHHDTYEPISFRVAPANGIHRLSVATSVGDPSQLKRQIKLSSTDGCARVRPFVGTKQIQQQPALSPTRMPLTATQRKRRQYEYVTTGLGPNQSHHSTIMAFPNPNLRHSAYLPSLPGTHLISTPRAPAGLISSNVFSSPNSRVYQQRRYR